MNYCSNCGNKVDHNDNFCTKCGSSLKMIDNDQVNVKNKEKKFYYFEDEYNDYISACRFNIDEARGFYNANVCGSCGCIIEKQLKTNITCSNCKKKIYIRTDIISKDKLELIPETLEEYEKYDKKVRDLLFYEKLMNRNAYIHTDYMQLFKSLKERLPSRPRDIMWRFANEVYADLDRTGAKLFMAASKLPPEKRIIAGFDAVNKFSLSVQEEVLQFQIAEHQEHLDIALDILTHIAYRDVHLTVLDSELNDIHRYTVEDYTSKVHSALIIEFLNKYSFSLDDFKRRFLELRHPFILERLSNQECWKYIEIALKNQIEWDNR